MNSNDIKTTFQLKPFVYTNLAMRVSSSGYEQQQHDISSVRVI
jgi:hypothetical protein